MIKIDLITGFLGSGKTTFLKQYARNLMQQGMKIGILENDFGAVNVDMLLLQELLGEQCDLEMVSGGCDRDCHQRRFKTKLIAMGMRGFDRVIVEPSGLYDVDEFFDTLREEPLEQWYEIGSVIAIVDAKMEKTMSPVSEYLLASQIAGAGQVVLSKVQEATPEDIANSICHLNRALQQIGCERRVGAEVIQKEWGQFTQEDFDRIRDAGYRSEAYVKRNPDEMKQFQSLFFMEMHVSEKQLGEAARQLFSDPECGNVFRVKGFIPQEDHWVEINATKEQIEIRPLEKGQEIFIVTGEKLKEEKIRNVVEEHRERMPYEEKAEIQI